MVKAATAARVVSLRVFDLAALVLAFPIAYASHDSLLKAGDLEPMRTYVPALAITILLWSACAWMYQVYEPQVGRGAVAGELARTSRALAMVAVAVAAMAFLMKEAALSRLVVAVYFAVAFLFIIGVRVAARAISRMTVSGPNARRYAVVGTGGMAREIVESITAHPEWGLRFAGFVRLDGTRDRSRGPMLGVLSRLGRILEDEVLDMVVFAVPRERLADVERGMQLCEEQGVEVRISLDILRFGTGTMTIADLDGVPMLAFTRTPSDAIALAAKRVFDMASSALVLVLLAPVLAGVAIAIRLDSDGPVFFRQRRVGLNGRIFHMLKFRSMYRDAEERLAALKAQNEMSGPVFKMKNDPRVTRMGRFLRKTSLDEFPQFWNVLKGEMSIVGPRPPIPAEVREYKRWQRRRLSMRPGITCVWQISGRNNIDFDHWMEMDLDYIDRWSLWSDLAICLKTVPAVLSARGAR
jgi:exopolysaccharide biosynthesis polyprenyl glycosylphosphotransferase